MKKAPLILSACVVMLTSCSKSGHNESTPDNGCIERVFVRQSQPILAPAQIRTADSLLDVNHIAHTNYRYLGLRQDSFNSHLEQYITVDQYANGRRLFTSQVNYLFWDGIIHYTSGAPIKGTTLDTIPSLDLARLRTLFSNDLKKREAGAAGGLNGNNVSYGYRDSCYKAEFGYIDIAANGAPENLVKAWRVSIKNSNAPDPLYPIDPPYAFYKDSNGQLIGFVGNIIVID
ncbi:MAG TPA: hypothetical protein VHD83_27085 [Puia sp.]|nr:hypothetical protein [Puia sp.]